MGSIELAANGFVISAASKGLVVTGKPTVQDWIAFGTRLGRAHRVVQFAVGDWIVYGERTYGERFAESESFNAALEAVRALGWSEKTVGVYRWLAERVPPKSRRLELSIKHHLAVAAFPPKVQSAWLARAVRGRWTASMLQRQIAGRADESERLFLTTGGLTEAQYETVTRCLRALGVKWQRQQRRRRSRTIGGRVAQAVREESALSSAASEA